MKDTYQRINKIIAHYGITLNSFCEKLGLMSTATISKIIHEKRTPSQKTIGRIINAFPEISYEWLVNGEGEMLKESKVKAQPVDHDNFTLTAVQVTEFMRKYYPYSTKESEDTVVRLIEKSQDKIINFLKASYIPEKVSREVHFKALTEKMYEGNKVLDTKITYLNEKMEHIDTLIEEIEKYNLIEEIRKVQLQNRTK
tara:strand:- start:903 stop:1496 length:594 start_codon:yes stop_codon:yes gene_type:complete